MTLQYNDISNKNICSILIRICVRLALRKIPSLWRSSVELEFAGESEVLGENLLQCPFFHHKCQMT
jgi:hypothetical protein